MLIEVLNMNEKDSQGHLLLSMFLSGLVSLPLRASSRLFNFVSLCDSCWRCICMFDWQ